MNQSLSTASPSLRKSLQNLGDPRTTHPGLWLDKYIPEHRIKHLSFSIAAPTDIGKRHQEGNQDAELEDTDGALIRVNHLKKSIDLFKNILHSTDTPDKALYQAYFNRWQRMLISYGAHTWEARTLGRMVVGLGEESVLETSIRLHHTYGVPIIPGSALKGLTARFAAKYLGDEWSSDSLAYKTMFGDEERQGRVMFFDALPFPDNRVMVDIDVMTVHHRKYYEMYMRQSLTQNRERHQNDGSMTFDDPEGHALDTTMTLERDRLIRHREDEKDGARQILDSAPGDWDHPNPVTFLSTRGIFLIALAGEEAWVEAAINILQQGVYYAGIGAKTSSGYGRLWIEKKNISVDPLRETLKRTIEDLRRLKNTEVASQINRFYERWKELDVPISLKRELAQAIIDKVKEAGREKKSQEKAWYRELLESLSSH